MIKMNKLTPIQIRALDKLSCDEWKSAYELKESSATLNALCNKGYAESKFERGSFAFPRTSVKFKKKSQTEGWFDVIRGKI